LKFPGAKGLDGVFSYLFRLHTIPVKPQLVLKLVLNLLLAGILAVVSQAQEASRPTSGAEAAAPVKAVTPASEKVVIKVGNLQLTQADFESALATLEEQQGPADLTRRAIGENYASLLMLAQQALANHLDSSPEVIRQLAIDRNQILSNAEFAKLKDLANPTAEEIRAYYSAHGADYDVVDLRRLFVWQNSSSSKDGKGMSPQDAQALIAAVRQAFASGSDPAKLVQGKKDILLDPQPIPFQRGELPPKLNEAAFALQPGQWGVVEQTPDALVLIYVAKRYQQPLQSVSLIIEKKLQNQKLRNQMEDLKKSTGFWLDEQYFGASTPVSVSSTQPNPSAPTNSVKREEKDKDERQK
jgi:hypothetical protein